MVFVFGIDVPLIELLVSLAVLGLVLVFIATYAAIRAARTHRVMRVLLERERRDLLLLEADIARLERGIRMKRQRLPPVLAEVERPRPAKPGAGIFARASRYFSAKERELRRKSVKARRAAIEAFQRQIKEERARRKTLEQKIRTELERRYQEERRREAELHRKLEEQVSRARQLRKSKATRKIRERIGAWRREFGKKMRAAVSARRLTAHEKRRHEAKHKLEVERRLAEERRREAENHRKLEESARLERERREALEAQIKKRRAAGLSRFGRKLKFAVFGKPLTAEDKRRRELLLKKKLLKRKLRQAIHALEREMIKMRVTGVDTREEEKKLKILKLRLKKI